MIRKDIILYVKMLLQHTFVLLLRLALIARFCYGFLSSYFFTPTKDVELSSILTITLTHTNNSDIEQVPLPLSQFGSRVVLSRSFT